MGNDALFGQATRTFIDVVASIPPEKWTDPGLGTWDVRSLVGHTARAILTVENYLQVDEPGIASVATAEAYFATVYAEVTSPEAVAARGVEAGIWLGEDPVARISEAEARTLELIQEQPDNRLVSIGGMGMPLDEYLRTRVFELVVHTLDIARATGVPANIPSAPLAHTLALAAGIAAATGRAETLLMALTGRTTLPEGFTVV